MRMAQDHAPMAKPTHKGFFLTFEGGEGSGKSTQARLFFEWAQSQGIPSILTREPGGTDLGTRIRRLLLDKTEGELCSRSESLLYQADRAQHVESKILPALKAGSLVICDRFADSSVVYQGVCRGLGVSQIQALNRYSTGGLEPDLVVLMDIPAKVGMARVQARAKAGAGLDRMEAEAAAFHKKVRSGFLKLARSRSSRYVVFDARKAEPALSDAIRETVEKRLIRRRLWQN